MVYNVGLCICLYDITKLEDSYIFPGDGASHTKGLMIADTCMLPGRFETMLRISFLLEMYLWSGLQYSQCNNSLHQFCIYFRENASNKFEIQPVPLNIITYTSELDESKTPLKAHVSTQIFNND